MTPAVPAPVVLAVARSARHTFTKPTELSIRLIPGLGVEGDVHSGVKAMHTAHIRRDPDQPNLRQVHLMHAELFDELAAGGFKVGPGELGENVTTRGLDILGLPTGTRLRLGDAAVIELTGLRNPCRQLDAFQQGLMAATLDRAADGALIRKSGVMAVVIEGGDVRPGDSIIVELPAEPRKALAPV